MFNPATHIIAVDQGNTHTRFASYDIAALKQLRRGTLPNSMAKWSIRTDDLQTGPLEGRPCWLEDATSPWYIASVHRVGIAQLRAWHAAHLPESSWHELHTVDFEVRLAVREPTRVGADRLAAANAACWRHGTGEPLIVVDVGTAITVDVVDATGTFLGGAILAGPTLNLRALGAMTNQLPTIALSEAGGEPPVIGKDTVSALASGAAWGAVGAVRELGQRMEALLGGTGRWVITGGGGVPVARSLGKAGDYDADLVLAGVALCGRAWDAPT